MSLLRALNELDEQIHQYQRKNDGQSPGLIVVHPELRNGLAALRDRFRVNVGIPDTYKGISLKIGDFLQPDEFVLGTKHKLEASNG